MIDVLKLRAELGVPENLSAMGIAPDRIDELSAMAIEDPSARRRSGADDARKHQGAVPRLLQSGIVSAFGHFTVGDDCGTIFYSSGKYHQLNSGAAEPDVITMRPEADMVVDVLTMPSVGRL